MGGKTPKPDQEEFQRLLTEAQEEKSYAICGRWASTSGKVCTKPEGWGVEGRDSGPCKYHGGASLRGPEHPNWTNGKQSRYAHPEIAEKVERLLEDDDIMELRQEAVLLSAAIQERLEEMYDGGKPWERLDELVAQLRGMELPDQAEGLVEELVTIVTQGQDRQEGWEDIRDLVDTKRRVVRDDFKRQETLDSMIPATDALAFAHRVANAVNEHVSDPAEREAIRSELRGAVVQVVHGGDQGNGQLPGR